MFDSNCFREEFCYTSYWHDSLIIVPSKLNLNTNFSGFTMKRQVDKLIGHGDLDPPTQGQRDCSLIGCDLRCH